MDAPKSPEKIEKSNKRKKNVPMYVSKWIFTVDSDRFCVKCTGLDNSDDVGMQTNQIGS